MQMIQYCVINAEIVAADSASVPVQDRGFRFGDGAFETIAVFDGVPYQWDLHIKRLADGLAALRIDFDTRTLKPLCKALLQKNQHRQGFLRIAISRGAGSAGYRPTTSHPTCVIETMPERTYDGTPCRLHVSTWRKAASNQLPAGYKLAAQGVGNTLALLEAADNACEDAIMLSASGLIAETASANLFWIKRDTLFTPSLETGCVAGTTRDAIIRLSPLPVSQVESPLETLLDTDEIFMSNVRYGVRACVLAGTGPAIGTYRHLEMFSALLADDQKRETLTESVHWQ